MDGESRTENEVLPVIGILDDHWRSMTSIKDYARTRDSMKNIILIGLPSAGKSTVGVILAKTLGMNFIDTDIVIQENTGKLLQEIIDMEGSGAFLEIEEKTILSLDCHNTVIATGGSVVFSRRAMDHLTSGGIVLYLDISFEEMVKRLNNITTRGIVLDKGQSLRDMYDQRIPLYEKYADIRIDCSDDDFEIILERIVNEIHEKLTEDNQDFSL